MKKPAGSVKLFTAIMVGVALIFSACNCLENYLLHPGLPELKVDICLALEKYVPVNDIDSLKRALTNYDSSPRSKLYRIIVRKTVGGPDEPPLGNADDCCKPLKSGDSPGPQPSSTTVTQRVKYQTGAGGPNSEAAFKEIVRLLGESKKSQ